jgi:hypothetical protein
MSDLAVIMSAVASVVNTALLVWARFKLAELHTAVNGAHDAALQAQRSLGVLEGRVGDFPTDVGKTPT